MRLVLRSLLIATLFTLLLPLAGAAEFVGLDANGDQECGPDDMVYQATPADVGTTRTLGVFFDDLPPIMGLGCTFCVTDGDRIGSWTWTYSLPGAWVTFPALHSDSSDSEYFPIVLSPYIPERYPNYLCWLVQGFDFTIDDPVTLYPFTVGTFEYQVASEGCIQWLFDTGNVAVQSTSFGTFWFDAPGEACDTVSCPGVTAAEAESWGAVKKLFR